MRSCPYCGAPLTFERMEKIYTCSGCGAALSLQDIVELRERARAEKEKTFKEKRRHEEYLEWWLSSKK
ncbi:MAG: hypothetical protein RMJ28_04390 [Nitrososphaerota archaeon]|nr:hypothetical protein [Candidatus Calditenuaceae archaeon]MDW8073459.1 hypothetical protein [Nitrososphaerota archaeon]